MSKKIIYLLSLLMALSLVFASCKKNGLDPNNGGLTPPPQEEDNTEKADKATGLFPDYDSIPKTDIIKRTTVFKSGEDFYRNPVVIAFSNNVFFFSEVRYKRDGAANDVGIDGEGVVDIVYKASGDSGTTFGQVLTVNKDNTITSEVDKSHGAAVVFKAADNKIVVAASAGGGIGRTKQKVGETGKLSSRVDYIVGTVSGTTITWGDWKEVNLNGQTIADKIKSVDAGQGKKFEQYGTQSARGYMDGTDLVLSIVLAQQGSLSDVYELMGRYTLKGTLNGDTITWTPVGEPIAYSDKEGKNLGSWKETQVKGGNSANYSFIVVPSPWTPSPAFRLGKADGTSVPNGTAIQSSEGAPGYVDLDKKWFGKNPYTVTSGKMTEGTDSASILMHVKQTSANLTMYVVDADLTMKGKEYLINTVGKASSIDVLPDGTIITGAEEGGKEKNYYGVFTRYSQYYIAEKTGN